VVKVWGARHGGASWGLVMQHCGIAAGVTRLQAKWPEMFTRGLSVAA
jgi:hypothetical protein